MSESSVGMNHLCLVHLYCESYFPMTDTQSGLAYLILQYVVIIVLVYNELLWTILM